MFWFFTGKTSGIDECGPTNSPWGGSYKSADHNLYFKLKLIISVCVDHSPLCYSLSL
jgi:hypothetical protein